MLSPVVKPNQASWLSRQADFIRSTFAYFYRLKPPSLSAVISLHSVLGCWPLFLIIKTPWCLVMFIIDNTSQSNPLNRQIYTYRGETSGRNASEVDIGNACWMTLGLYCLIWQPQHGNTCLPSIWNVISQSQRLNIKEMM